MKVKNDVEVRLKVSADSSNTRSGIDDLNKKSQETPKHFDNIKNVGIKAFKATAVAVTATSTALGGLVMKSVAMAGELEQNIGGAEAVFKELGKELKDMQIAFKNDDGSIAYFKSLEAVSLDAYRTMGLAQSDYLATVNKMGSLMQGAGLDTQKSLQLSSEAMQRAADVASVMGIDINMAMESIAGAAKGNFTMMDNLGVAMNDTTLQAYALEKGIDKSTSAMTNAEKVELAMQMFLEKTQKMAGNYAKENETFAGSFQTLKASMTNFLSGASDVEPVVESLMSFTRILLKSIEQMAPKLIDGIIKLINEIVPELPKIINKLLPIIINGAISLVKGLVSILPSLIPILMNALLDITKAIIDMAPTIINELVKMLPVIAKGLADALPTLIPAIVQGIVSIMEVFNENIDLFMKCGLEIILGIVKGLINSIPIILKNLPTILMAIFNFFTVSKLLGAGMNLIKGLGTGLIKGLPNIIKNIPGLITKIISSFKNAGSLNNVGINLIKGLWNGIASVKSWILSKISGVAKSILDKVKGIFKVHSPSKAFYWIGQMDMIGLGDAFVDEKDNLHKTIEDTIGLDYLKNGTYNISAQMSGLNSSINSNQAIYVDVYTDLDVDKFGKTFVKNIKTFSGGSKNSYSGGY